MRILYIFSLCMMLSRFLIAEDLIEYDYELDSYYTNVSAYVDLDRDREITNGLDLSEGMIYKELFTNAFTPNIFLVEAAVHPMGIAGLYFRSLNENLYTNAKVQDFNIIKALTAGYAEPYSLSLFLGRMMVFSKTNSDRPGNNRAFMGYLFSIGDKTIKDNRSYNDKWLNFEVKLKGTRDLRNSDLDWSFRVGGRFHDDKDFADSLYIGARRKSIDYDKSIFSLIHNSAFSTMLAISADTYEIIEGEIIVEKVYPTSMEGLSLSFGVGYLYTSNNKYLNILRDDGVDNHQLIFRPNFKYKF